MSTRQEKQRVAAALRCIVVGVLVTVAVGWAIPLLGPSLLAFLILDAAFSVRQQVLHVDPDPAA
jgi:hypothetical protein